MAPKREGTEFRLHVRIHTAAALLLIAAMAHGQNVVKDIIIRGNARVSREAILASMTLKVGGTYSEQAAETDRATLNDFGFFSAVNVVGVPSDASPDAWTVRVDVKENPEIKEVRITGNTVVKTTEIMAKLSPNLKPGAILNTNELRPTVQQIVALYDSKGYSVEITEFETLADSPSTLSLVLLETKVGEISVEGNRLTKSRTLQRMIKTRPGEVFSREKWRSDLARLFSTQWFDDVQTEPTFDRELGTVDLTLNLKEARTGTFNVGLQLDPRNSLAGIVRYSQTNVGGTGQTYGVSFLQSTQGVGPSLDLDYTNPFIDDRDTTLRVSLYSRINFRFQNGLFGQNNSTISNDQYYERRTGGSIGFSRPVKTNTFVGVTTRFEDVRTQNIDPNTTDGFVRQDGKVGVITLGFTRNRRDVDIDPSRGDWLQMTVEPGFSDINRVGGETSDQSIIGPNYFGKASLEYRRYWTDQPARGFKIDEPRRVLAFRTRMGTVLGNVPFFEQYFAGGVDSVRGYQEDRYWGRNLLVTTLEYRYPLQKSFTLVGFVDYGGAWGGYGSINNFSQSSKFKLHLGYGPGLAFKAGPLGNIQLYMGFNEEGKSRVHFLIGNQF